MITRHHPLIPQASGTQRHLVSWHFGTGQSGPKVVLQSSLHADELPGMLVVLHLKQRLEAAEQAGQLRGEVVLVPVANPIGLDQTVLHSQLGRFELATAQNFNRHYPDLATWLLEPEHSVWPALTPEAATNRGVIRRALHAALDRHPPETELDSLRHTLMRLSVDADVVLDLHCDFQAVVHLYTEPPCVDRLWPLACRLGARAVLVAEGSGGRCFDEALSGVWWQLRQRLTEVHGQAAVAQRPIDQGCVSATVELRGQTDVTHALAASDADAILGFLHDLGLCATPAPPPPPACCEPTPLAGTQSVKAPHPGVISFHRQPGDALQPGDAVADVIDPLTGQTSTLRSTNHGVLYATHIVRWATTGLELAKIAGQTPHRTGPLLGA